MPDRTTLLVTCEKEAVEPLLLALRAYDVDAQASGQRNLDGASITSWLVVAGLAVKMAPEILRSLAELVEKVRFRRVEVDPGSGKVVIDNPTKQQIEELIAGLDNHRAIHPAPEDPPGA